MINVGKITYMCTCILNIVTVVKKIDFAQNSYHRTIDQSL